MATAGEYPSCSRAPRIRWNVIVGKKSFRSALTSTCLPTWGAALVRIDRPFIKPWAAGCVGKRWRTF